MPCLEHRNVCTRFHVHSLPPSFTPGYNLGKYVAYFICPSLKLFYLEIYKCEFFKIILKSVFLNFKNHDIHSTLELSINFKRIQDINSKSYSTCFQSRKKFT